MRLLYDFIVFMKAIAYGDGSLKKATSTLRVVLLQPFQGEIRLPAMRVVVDCMLFPL
jgi:hypothetical protein